MNPVIGTSVEFLMRRLKLDLFCLTSDEVSLTVHDMVCIRVNDYLRLQARNILLPICPEQFTSLTLADQQRPSSRKP